MLVGHFAVGLIAKRFEPKLSLGTATLASLLPDLLWCLFLIAGIEHVRFKPGIIVQPGMRALDALAAPDVVYSHSLFMGVVWGALLAAAYFARRYSAVGATVIFVAVLSHWLLDFVSHPPDMPLAPGLDTRSEGRTGTLELRSRNSGRRRCVVARRLVALSSTDPSRESRRQHRLLGHCPCSHAGVDKQHHRTPTLRAIRDRHQQPDLLLIDDRRHLLDRPASTQYREDAELTDFSIRSPER